MKSIKKFVMCLLVLIITSCTMPYEYAPMHCAKPYRVTYYTHIGHPYAYGVYSPHYRSMTYYDLHHKKISYSKFKKMSDRHTKQSFKPYMSPNKKNGGRR